MVLAAGNKPLSLVSSLPENGSVDVANPLVIELEFSNNVVNLSVQEINRSAILLKDKDGNLQDIEIIFPDDQLEPDKKRLITVRSLSTLPAGKEFFLEIDGTLQAKNGSVLKEKQILNFTTER